METLLPRELLVCLVLLLSSATTIAEEFSEPKVVLPEFEIVPVTTTVSMDGTRKVWGYRFPVLDTSTPESREATYKPYHFMYSPDGSILLTKGPGGLYTHHRGLFYGFSKITYGNGKTCDTWHCPEGAYQ